MFSVQRVDDTWIVILITSQEEIVILYMGIIHRFMC